MVNETMSFWDLFRDRVFISYDYDHDSKYKNLLVAWAANKQFSLAFYDSSVDVSVNSDKAGPVKRVISQRIRGSDYLLCIIGKYTHRSPWIAWEIEKAKELNIPLVGVKIARTNKPPKGMLASNASWANTFKLESIRKAIESAGEV